MAPKKKQQPESFEVALAELETLVQQLEKGELPLTDALAAFKQGVELTHYCQKTLNEAEQTVAQMVAEQGDFVLDQAVQEG